MKRRVEYSWRLREIMAARGLNNISDIMPLLIERGIDLSPSQLYRMLGQRPDRISLALLGAICDALECSVEDLCQFRIEAASSRKRLAAGDSGVVDLNSTIRPKRARIRPAE